MITDLKPCRVCGKPVEILPNHAIESVCETCRAFDTSKEEWVAKGRESCPVCRMLFLSTGEKMCPACVMAKEQASPINRCAHCGKIFDWDGLSKKCATCQPRPVCRKCGNVFRQDPRTTFQEDTCATCRAFENAKDWIAEGKERNKPIINQCQKCGTYFKPASQSLIETVCPTCAMEYTGYCRICQKSFLKNLTSDTRCPDCCPKTKPEGILFNRCKVCGLDFMPMSQTLQEDTCRTCLIAKEGLCATCGGPGGPLADCFCVRQMPEDLDRLLTLAGHQATYLAHAPPERCNDKIALEVEDSFYRISAYLETKLLPKVKDP